ncbi:MAG: uroporphyrinogen-III C-methyltransferase [Panacagrimonas sp.]
MTEPTLDAPSASSSPATDNRLPLSAPAKPATLSVPRRRGAVRLLGIILLLLLLTASGWIGWQFWKERDALARRLDQQAADLDRFKSRTEDLETQLREITTRQSDLSRQGDRNGSDIATIQTRAEESFVLMSRIGQELSGGRARFQLAAIEHLLLLASDRLLLHHDATSALVALDIADERLAALSDPALFPVREALAQERTTLRAVPRPDLASATLSLSALIERIPQLPLAARAPTRYASPDSRASTAAVDAASGGWRRLLASVQSTLESLVTIRRDDNSRSLRLLPPESEAIVYQVLTLKLEGARVALLRGDTVPMREELRSASAWLDQQFRQDDPGVLAARGELDRLAQLDLSPPLPETGRSLALLRAQLSPKP